MIRLKCNNCDKIHEFHENELEYECIASDPYRQMGTENEYEGTLEFDCDNCQNQIISEFHFWEYPAKVLNFSEYKEEGCVILEEPNYNTYLIETEIDDYED